MFDPITEVARYLGIAPLTLSLLLGVFVAVCNLTAKLIPDDTRGFWGGIRSMAKVGGLYVSSRISGNLTTADAAKLALQDYGAPVEPSAVAAVEAKLTQASVDAQPKQ